MKKKFSYTLGKVLLVVALCLMVVGTLPLMTVEAATLDVYPIGSCPSAGPGIYCNDIQGAINDAASGDIVYLHNGIYNVSSQINIYKSDITLRGESQAGVIINSTSTGYQFDVGGSITPIRDSITLENFTLNGNPAGTYGLKIAGVTNVNVNYITVNNTGKTAVDFNGVHGGIVAFLSLNNTVSGNGLTLTDSSNFTVSNVTTTNNAWGGIALYSSTYYSPTGVDNVVFSNNSLHELAKIYSEGGATEFTNIDFGSYNQYMAQNLPGTPSGRSNHKYYFDSLVNAQNFLTYSYLGNPIVPVENRVLTNLTSMHKEVYPDMTIQAAIDASEAGGTIDVMAGTYTEQVDVNKRVILNGVGNGDNPISDTIITFTNAPVVEISGSGLSQGTPLAIRNLRILPMNTAGLFVDNGNTVSNIEIADVMVVGTGTINYTNEQEVGLRVNPSGSILHMWMKDSEFSSLDYGWYFFKGSSDSSVVSNITVDDTIFDGNVNKGMYLEKLSEATFNDLTVTNNGIPYLGAPGGAFWNEKWNAGIDFNLKYGDYQNLVFNDLIATGNALGFEEGAGVMIKARDSGSYGANPATLNRVRIDGAVITGNERGIRFGEPGNLNLGPMNVVVINSELHSNVATGSGGTEYGDLINMSQAQVDARSNWWGAADGPSGGNTDPVTFEVADSLTGGYVGVVTRFSPWLGILPGTGDSGGGGQVANNDNFTLPNTGGLAFSSTGFSLPKTGFVPNQISELPDLSVDYARTGMVLSIPKLGISSSIVGVPFEYGEWDIRWIGDQIGYLEGSSFPTYEGNTVLTGHAYDSSGLVGVFHDLEDLSYGDVVELAAWGDTYTYKVVDTSVVGAKDTSVLGHEDYDVLTLITCHGYDETINGYRYRTVVKAILVGIK